MPKGNAKTATCLFSVEFDIIGMQRVERDQ